MSNQTKAVHELDIKECMAELNEIFYVSQKTKEPQTPEGKEAKDPQDKLIARYKELAQRADAVIKRLDELDKTTKIEQAMGILKDVSKEEILKALGIKLPKDTSVNTNTEESKPKIKIQYVNLNGEIATAEVAEAGNTPKENGIREFVKYAKDEKNILRPAIAAMTEVEFKNTFADYIAKVKAQAA